MSNTACTGTPSTYFAPAERLPVADVTRQHDALAADPLVRALLDSFPEPAAILNRERQIVFANDKLSALTARLPESLLGNRMGEAIGCEQGRAAPNGCGTTRVCELCGAAQAIAHTQRTLEPARQACRITLAPEHGRESLDLGVCTTPVGLNGGDFLVFAIQDTSAEQRRRVLERMFFHDVLNSAGALQALLGLLQDSPPEEAEDLSKTALQLAEQVVDEVRAQRDLAAAERGELDPRPDPVYPREMIETVAAQYRHHTEAHGKQVVVEAQWEGVPIVTDPVLLRRVLGNLVKNALEASRPGQVVTLRYRRAGCPTFEVTNETVMPEAIRLQVFRRSFSTKQGSGRGVGTYSARLITEKYLGGSLTFRSNESDGTVFTVELGPQPEP
jgi:signal transduction histidine kinase